jgi:glycosyltransferase involved in cell wall biosynthesis
VAVVAPPWLPVPPPGYGGIEAVVAALVRGLSAAGHDVTLFAAPGSASAHARVVPVLDRQCADDIGRARHEADHVRTLLDLMPHVGGFDVIHDHGDGTLLAFADRFGAPVVHTLHGPFDAQGSAFYARHAHRARFVALSRAQLADAPAQMNAVDVIPNPIEPDEWPLCTRKHGYVLWIGRFAPEKGAHLAIAAARAAGRTLVLAGPVQQGQARYFEREVRPHVDDSRVVYAGEVGGALKRDLFAHASALLMPISWPEPFGMVMAEAMACGTPVLALRAGSTPEVVEHGVSGFVVDDPGEFSSLLPEAERLDPTAVRESALRRFGVATVAAAHEATYRRAIGLAASAAPSAWSTASAS